MTIFRKVFNILKNKNFYNQFNLYFIVYGIIIAIICISTSYYFQLKEIKESLDKSANEIFNIKINSILKPYINDVDNILIEIKNNLQVKNFINDRDNSLIKKDAEQILYAIASTNSTIKQIRIIDNIGNEVIRIEKNPQKNKTIISNNLQDKAYRYYFKELSSMKEEKIWYSKFDLNEENGKVEIPFAPTLRVGIPIIKDNIFQGAIILNLYSKELFTKISTSSGFEPYIIDKDFNYILHPNNQFSHNKYKNIKRDFTLDFPKGLRTDGVYSFPLKNIIDNEDEAIMILKVKKDFETVLINEKSDVAVVTLLVVILFSFVISYIVSRSTIKLQNALHEASEQLEINKILEKYVISSTTHIDSTILNVSEAFENACGYKKEELIGKKINIIKNPNRDSDIIKELWSTILKGKIWIGEIENKKKDGESYWLKQHIIPKFDINGNIEKFVSVGIDMTANKRLEKLASIDNLTQIYNRRMIDEFLKTEIDIAKRYKRELSLIIFDIDYFKSVNDTFGHLVGDKVLIETAKLISKNLRKADVFGRYGGEEFIIICTETNLNSAYLLAEKLRINIEKHLFDEVGQKTISLGVSKLNAADTFDSLIKKADSALYDSKNRGRNRTTVYDKLD